MRNEYGYPDFESEAMQELNNWYKQLNALLGTTTGIFNPYTNSMSVTADIGIALKQSALLAHDIEYMCTQLYEQYQEAQAKERDELARARLAKK